MKKIILSWNFGETYELHKLGCKLGSQFWEAVSVCFFKLCVSLSSPGTFIRLFLLRVFHGSYRLLFLFLFFFYFDWKISNDFSSTSQILLDPVCFWYSLLIFYHFIFLYSSALEFFGSFYDLYSFKLLILFLYHLPDSVELSVCVFL